MVQRRLFVGFVVASLLAVVGCGEPRLDGSSDAAYEASLEKVRTRLAGDKLESFNRALTRVALSAAGSPLEMLGDPEAALARGRAAVDGMTADEVIAAAKAAPALPVDGPVGAAVRAADRVRQD